MFAAPLSKKMFSQQTGCQNYLHSSLNDSLEFASGQESEVATVIEGVY
jgi:hypothetical protein